MKWVVFIMLWGDPGFAPLPEEEWGARLFYKTCDYCNGTPRYDTYEECRAVLTNIIASATPETRARMNALCIARDE